MGMWHKHSRPIDRAVRDLDRQIVAVRRQIRELSQPGASEAFVTSGGTTSGTDGSSATDTAASFFRQMLSPTKKCVVPSYHARRDLLDIGAEPLRELEAEPVVSGKKPDQGMYSSSEKPAETRTTGTTVTQSTNAPSAQEKLAHYLSAGSIKTYKPLKRAQRQARNRFLMWIGLSFLALWLIYVVVR